MNRIHETFSRVKLRKAAALMPYLPLGYPTLDLSLSLVHAAVESGADLLELGIPFSDPLADGPVIQHATQRALENGTTVARCIELVSAARASRITIPLVMMGYYNPILRYGLERFARDAAAAGADGVIVPDLPLEEASEFRELCGAYNSALVFLAAPTSTAARLKRLGAATRGFLYLVSLTGVTGARSGLADGLADFVQRARDATAVPVCVGFGISTPAHAQTAGRIADGVIVGSALVSRIGDPTTAVPNARTFIAELNAALASS